MTGGLFGPHLPDGADHRAEFVTAAEEAALLDAIQGVRFSDFAMRGVVARRRVAFFGETYHRGEAEPMPAFLHGLRAAFAAWAAIEPSSFTMALINEYPPGAPIGWHRDAPQYGLVAGLSLLSACRMKFRRYQPPGAPRGRRVATHEVVLEPRSAYLLRGAARWAYEHHVPPVVARRYSITLRTARETRLAAETP